MLDLLVKRQTGQVQLAFYERIILEIGVDKFFEKTDQLVKISHTY